MPVPLQAALRTSIGFAKRTLKSNQTIRNLITDVDNSTNFTRLEVHEEMIADAVRVNSYHDAIRRHVRTGDTVVDLGTGTGILAMFAAQQGADRVYALDHSPFIEVARRIAASNGIQNVTFVQANSRDFALEERVDLVIHEQMGDALFEENMVINLLDLKRRILKPGGRILPGRFDLFIEPIELVPQHRLPYIWEQQLHGLDFTSLHDEPLLDRYRTSRYEYFNVDPHAVDHFLGEPAPVLSFDLNEMSSDDITHGVETKHTVTRSGRLDGLCVYFRVRFDETLAFDTSPLSERTHWTNRVLRVPSRKYREGDCIAVRVTMPEHGNMDTWRVEVG